MEWGRIFWVSGRVVLGGGGGTNHVCLDPDPLTLVDIINDYWQGGDYDIRCMGD